ncbi:MAG TPA: imidazole glycerol phosphate synthase subunit HisH [Terriglobia bacterium]|nr:imidazole glycerol phosphate synthase subunit HisH [Terriglobia bacterium]
MIALIDYGGGNVGSVLKAIEYLGASAKIVDRPEDLAAASKIILPGQGHLGSMMKALRGRGMIGPLREIVSASATAATGSGSVLPAKYYLGICLGLQALYAGSEEAPGIPGFGLLAGQVTRFDGSLKVPHVGWSQLETSRDSTVLRGVETGSFVYYCHSYYGPATDETVATTDYGQRFAAAAEVGRAWAVQFHPEKSGGVGLRVLRNFLEA